MSARRCCGVAALDCVVAVLTFKALGLCGLRVLRGRMDCVRFEWTACALNGLCVLRTDFLCFSANDRPARDGLRDIVHWTLCALNGLHVL